LFSVRVIVEKCSLMIYSIMENEECVTIILSFSLSQNSDNPNNISGVTSTQRKERIDKCIRI